MKKRSIYIFLAASLGLMFSACSSKKKEAEKMEDMPGMPGMKMPAGDKAKNNDAAFNLDSNALKALLRPTTQFVVASLPVTTLQQSNEAMEMNALGSVQYDNGQIHSLSSRIAGRIEKLYVRYRYEFVNKGQKVLEMYSPELLTAQQNLIFILRSDPTNQSLITAARQRLLLLGMSVDQVSAISRSGKPFYSVAVYSPFSGYVTERGFTGSMDANTGNNMQQENTSSMTSSASLTTSELPVKEGMYVDKAQAIFSLIDASRGRISLSIFADQQNMVKKGTPVMIVPETAPAKKFRATIDRIEPFYQAGSKTLSARVYFNNATMRLPIGSQVQATIFMPPQTVYTLPASAVITTGLNNVVFKKEGPGFSPKEVIIGFRNTNRVQITSGLSVTDSVAVNAQHLIESESIIKVKK